MNKINLRYNCLIVVIFLVLNTGCHTRQIVSGEKKLDEFNPEISMMHLLEKKAHNFKTLKARKIDVEFTRNSVQDQAKANLAIYRDSLIAVSIIPALGYEAMRIMCTPDSVIIIDRTEKYWYGASFDYYRRKYQIPVEFADLQAILANEVFYYKDKYPERIYERQINTREENMLCLVDAYREGKRITNQGIEIDATGTRLENIFVVDYDVRMRLNINYENFTEANETYFPKRISMDIIESNNTMRLEINYGQVIFNDSINVDFDVPKHYTRGDI